MGPNMGEHNVRQYSREAKQELASLRKLSDANKRALKLLGEHADPNDIADAYEAVREQLAPNFISRLISARRKELERELNEKSAE